MDLSVAEKFVLMRLKISQLSKLEQITKATNGKKWI
jgi:hypothetical protein